MKIIDGAGRFTAPEGSDGNHWAEHFRVADLSVGTYSIPAAGVDDQEPHTEDEIYVVTAGHGVLVAGGQRAEVGPGTVAFVPAGEEHRFTEVTEDLTLLVVFAPAYGSRTGGAGAAAHA